LEDTLSEIFTDCWGGLMYGSFMADHAFHIGTIGTQNQSEINLRTVVLRSVEPDNKEIIFYTDIRSAKMDDLKFNPNVSWLFYDHKQGLQLRVSGDAVIHHDDDIAASHWGKVHSGGKKSYMAKPAPSTTVDKPADGLEYLSENSDLESGYKNFAVIITQVNFIEWLSLKSSGHRRAQFKLIDGSWKGAWLIP